MTIFFIACGLGGCQSDSHFIEAEDSQYNQAHTMLMNKQYNDALVIFIKITEAHANAPESHLEAGRIYLNQLQDPIMAIYHFRKYLELRPEAPQSPMVKQLVDTAKKEFVRQLPGPSLGNDDSKVTELIQQLREENHRLKDALTRVQQTTTQQVIQAAIAESQQYSVQASDTLSTISQKVYGTPNRWRDIYKANPQLKSPNSLKVGQILTIPE